MHQDCFDPLPTWLTSLSTNEPILAIVFLYVCTSCAMDECDKRVGNCVDIDAVISQLACEHLMLLRV